MSDMQTNIISSFSLKLPFLVCMLLLDMLFPWAVKKIASVRQVVSCMCKFFVCLCFVYVAHLVLAFTSWFHGKISGPEAVCKLQPSEDGLFLVRESIRHPGDYVLCVSVSGEVIHYRVIYQDSKLTIDNTQYFYNLIDMIEVRGSLLCL